VLRAKLVDEIFKLYHSKNYTFVPGIINVVRINDNFEIYDGNHRYTAAIKYHKEYNIVMKVIIYVLDNEDDLDSEFKTVNKSIPVPEIYLQKCTINDNIKKQLCENIVKYIVKNYTSFKSTSFRPRIPNFNQDVLMDDLSVIMNHNYNINVVISAMTKLNEQIKHEKIDDDDVPKKCKECNFYIFLDKEWKIRLNNILTQPLNLLQ
jgi:hypothetical protein